MSKTQLEVYETGTLCVVGFGGREILDNLDLPGARNELSELIRTHECQAIAFDLTNVKLLPSGLLGLLASIHKLNIRVMLYNASADIREVLEITRLNSVLELHNTPVSA